MLRPCPSALQKSYEALRIKEPHGVPQCLEPSTQSLETSGLSVPASYPAI